MIGKITGFDLIERFKLDNKKVALIVIMGLAFLYADYSFILKPQMKSLNIKSKEAARLKNEIKSLQAELNNMRLVKKSGRSVTVRAKRLLFEPQLPSFLHDISKAANANNVRIINIKSAREQVKAAPKAPPVKLAPVSISLDLVCAYHNFGKFINAVENSDVFAAAEGFKIEAQKGDLLRQKISLILKTYVRI